ncbi:PucR family transcriptional regulator [Pseudonocardiaceae bacterium YIM PH 21723]|nr:PucR family transcriptional regulator [Pseudonocardiaceae bacterium YIM PH 21723]
MADPWRLTIEQLIAERADYTSEVVGVLRAEGAGYARLDAAEFQRQLSGMFQLNTDLLAGKRLPDPDEMRMCRDYGRRRAEQGIELEELLHGNRIAFRVYLRWIQQIGLAHGVSDQVLLEQTNYVLDVSDQLSQGFTAGHHQAGLELARLDEQERSEFTRAVLLGALSPADLGARAARHGLDLAATHVPFRTRTAAALSQFGDPLFITKLDGEHCGFAGSVGRTRHTVGRGPASTLDRLPAAFSQATRALHTALAFGRSGVHELADLGLLPAVLADSETGELLVERYLGKADPTLIETLQAYLDNNRHVDHTATALSLHANTVRYRLKA